ncbi:MAG: hypothetical protein WBI17_12855 [Clostridiaceae bacterium]
MIKFLDIFSKITKYCFYGLMLFFAGILLSILLGYFKFAQSQIPFYFMIGVALVALLSFISSDILQMLKRKAKVTTLIPEAVLDQDEDEEIDTPNEIEVVADEKEVDDSTK